MILEYLLLLNALATPPAPATPVAPMASAAAYAPKERAVDGWRIEGAFALDLKPKAAWALALGVEAAAPPRCVRLNNYWCVKHGGWRGEIAADPDGHAAFAAPRDGAAAAAMLLRRYYVDFKRRTAREIAARWAPAQCFDAIGGLAPIPLGAPIKPNLLRMLPQRPVPMGLAPRGLANTLRARWLGAHRGGMAARASARRRAAEASGLDLLPAPEIAVGMGEPAHARPPPPAAAALTPLAPLADCPDERLRVANYAARIAEGVAANPDQDLALVAPDGTPTANFAKVLANMAAVEIGPMRAGRLLVEDAVAHLRGERLAAESK